jgi:hypothetical protein
MRGAFWRTVVWAAGVGALLGFGCHSSSDRINLSNSDSGRNLAVAVGDEIDVTLQTIGPGEFGSPVLSSGSLRFLGESSPGAPNPGGARQLFRFEAAASGRAEVTIPHSRASPEGSGLWPAVAPFSITVEVH